MSVRFRPAALFSAVWPHAGPDRDDILNVGGFSDAVFEVVAAFAQGTGAARHWVEIVEAIEV